VKEITKMKKGTNNKDKRYSYIRLSILIKERMMKRTLSPMVTKALESRSLGGLWNKEIPLSVLV